MSDKYFSPWVLLAILLAYSMLLLAVGNWAEHAARRGREFTNRGWIYALSLTVYCTSWTFFGSVGSAATSGMLFSAIYLGPTLVMLIGWGVIRKMIRLRHRYQFSSVVDLITQRYGQSVAMGAFITVVLLVGMIPYIGLQLRTVIGSFVLLTGLQHEAATQWAGGHFVDEGVIVLIGVLSILFGLRRVDTRVRQHGMIAVLAVEAVVKLAAFVAVGLFVTYGLFDGLQDIEQRVAADLTLWQRFSGSQSPATNYVNWMTYLVLSMAAILFLPRMFHVMVVENHDERHLATAIWMFPLYLLLISFFVLPVALGGLLLGYPIGDADWFVIRLPLDHGSSALTLFAYLGGFSAAVGMTMVACTAMAIMFSNHIALPLMEHLRYGAQLGKYLRSIRWTLVFALLFFSYAFQKSLANSYLLIQMGLISFVAMLQFAPAALGAIFWQRGSRVGAWWGLGLGWAVWAYTLFLPALSRSNTKDPEWLSSGPFNIEFLRPEGLFHMSADSPLFNATFLSLLCNLLGYVIGSLMRPPADNDLPVIKSYVNAVPDNPLADEACGGDVQIDFIKVEQQFRHVLARYLPASEAELAGAQVLDGVTLNEDQTISGQVYLQLAGRLENILAGSIGAAMARKTVAENLILSEEESAGLEKTWSQQLAELKITPRQLREQIDYFRSLSQIATHHSTEMENKLRDLEAAVVAREYAVAALRESEQRFRSLADSAPVMVWLTGSKFGEDFFNRAWRAFTGRPLMEESGMGWTQGIHPDDRPAALELIERALEEQSNLELEFRLRRHDGEYRTMRVKAQPRLSDNGIFLGAVSSAIDITDLKAAEETLRRSNDELESMVRARTQELRQSMARQQESEGLKEMILLAMGEGLYRTDIEGSITFMNPSGAAMTGWTADALVGMPAHLTLHHTRRDGAPFPKSECPLYATFTDGEEHRSDDEVFWRRDGTPFDVALVSTPVVVDGQLVGAVVVFSDISERKQGERRINETVEQLRELNHQLEEAQNQLLQSEKMASIGQLAAGVAHEINNPVGFVNSNLGTLRKYSEQMLELIALYRSAESHVTDTELLARIADLKQALDLDFLNDDLPALIRESEDGLGRVKKIVQDLKDFSHVNESEWLFADLNAGLESTLNVVWNEVKYKANVVKKYGQIPPVECLAAQLNQVFMNLIVNAVHAFDESKGMGTLTLATGQQGDEVWVEVRDTGRGMSEEVKRRIFEPFFTTKPVGKGTGLGLSLSFSILQKHHGRFEVESLVGEGSCFRVWVPVKRQADASSG